MENTDILKKLSEPLKIEDVDFRIQSINSGGYATILAYKDARVDMKRLDDACGGLWQKRYKYIESKGLLFCEVGIKINGEWIWKEDIGTESFSDKQKGQASDAFKRACFNWGIGRELYDYPVIQLKLLTNEIITGEDGKLKSSYNLKLKDWKWEIEFNSNNKVKKLKAIDNNGKIRYDYYYDKQNNNSKYQINQDNTTQSQQNTSTSNQLEKWLNVLDSEKNFTKEWLNVADAINKKIITSVSDVRKYYKVSKETEVKINELLNFKID